MEKRCYRTVGCGEYTFEKGNRSLFSKVEQKDADGKTTYGYDTDKIYSAVKKFADAYNDMIDSGDGASLSGVRSAVSGMEGLTSANSSILKSIGISVGSNGHLSVNEATFKKSDMTVAKSLFQTSAAMAIRFLQRLLWSEAVYFHRLPAVLIPERVPFP